MGHSYFKKCVDFKFKYFQVSCILFCSHAWFVPSPSLVRSRLSYHGRSCFLVAISVCREQLCSRDLTEQPYFCFSLVFSSTKHHKEGLLWSQGATAGDQQASFLFVMMAANQPPPPSSGWELRSKLAEYGSFFTVQVKCSHGIHSKWRTTQECFLILRTCTCVWRGGRKCTLWRHPWSSRLRSGAVILIIQPLFPHTQNDFISYRGVYTLGI